jgi:MYND finger
MLRTGLQTLSTAKEDSRPPILLVDEETDFYDDDDAHDDAMSKRVRALNRCIDKRFPIVIAERQDDSLGGDLGIFATRILPIGSRVLEEQPMFSLPLQRCREAASERHKRQSLLGARARHMQEPQKSKIKNRNDDDSESEMPVPVNDVVIENLAAPTLHDEDAFVFEEIGLDAALRAQIDAFTDDSYTRELKSGDEFCANCLRNISPDVLQMPSGDVLLLRAPPPTALLEHPLVTRLWKRTVGCERCRREVYCSDQCRSEAWDGYHRAVCSESSRDYQAAMLSLRYSPSALLACRVIARLMLELVDGELVLADGIADLADALRRLEDARRCDDFALLTDTVRSLFDGGSWPLLAELESEAIGAIDVDRELTSARRVFASASFVKSIDPAVRALFLHRAFYRYMRGLCNVNQLPVRVQTTFFMRKSTPKYLSDHLVPSAASAVPYRSSPGSTGSLVEEADKEDERRDAAVAAKKKGPEFFANAGFPLHGIMLPRVGSLFNHSCKPNVLVDHPNSDHYSSYLSATLVERGQELTVAYVDPNLPLVERRQLLLEHWGFWCRCPKCIDEEHKQNKSIDDIDARLLY